VTTRIQIEAALVRGPLTDALIAAALDYYRDCEEMSYWDSLCEVHRVVDAAHAARDLAAAARIMAMGSPLAPRMMRQIIATCPNVGASWVMVLLIEGSAPPTLARAPDGRETHAENGAVTVGARWILRVAEELQHAAESNRAKHKSRTGGKP